MSEKQDALLYTSGYICYLLTQWIISVLIVRVTGLLDAGLFALAMTVTSMFYMVSSYGMRTFQISDISKKHSDQTYISSRIITVAAGFLLCLIYSYIADYSSRQIAIITVYMVFKSCEGFYDVLHGIWQNEKHLGNVGISLISKSIANLLAFVIPYLITKDLTVSLLFMAISAIFLTLIDSLYTKRTIKITTFFQWNFRSIFSLLQETLVMMFIIMLPAILNAIPRIILEKSLSTELLGVYNSVATPTALISAFASCIFLPLIPKFAKAYRDKKPRPIIKGLGTSLLIMTAIGVAGIILSLLWGEPILRLVFGNEVAEHTYLLNYVIIAVTMTAMLMCVNNFIIAARFLKTLLIASAIACIITFTTAIILIPQLQLLGAAYSLIIGQGIQLLSEIIFVSIILKRLATK